MKIDLEVRDPLPDLLDTAQRAIEDAVNDGIAHVRAQMARAPRPIGSCLSCDAVIAEGWYCDRFCREDHERLQRAQARNGTSQGATE